MKSETPPFNVRKIRVHLEAAFGLTRVLSHPEEPWPTGSDDPHRRMGVFSVDRNLLKISSPVVQGHCQARSFCVHIFKIHPPDHPNYRRNSSWFFSLWVRQASLYPCKLIVAAACQISCDKLPTSIHHSFIAQEMNPAENPVPSMRSLAGKQLLFELLAVNWERPIHRAIPDGGLSIGTHPGFNRRRNDDRSAIGSIVSHGGQEFFAAIVCDGVGSSEAGNLAATYALAICFEELLLFKTTVTLDVAIPIVLRRMDDFIRGSLDGTGTTTASVLVATGDGQLMAANVGDSRIYAWNVQKSIRQVSEDDTIENELRKLAIKDPSVIAAHGLQGSLSQALGEIHRDSEQLRIDLLRASDFENGMILTTDGIWKGSSFNSFAKFAPSSFEVVRRLLAMATWSGGMDNSTIIAIDSIASIRALFVENRSTDVHFPKIVAWFSDSKFHAYDNASCNQTNTKEDPLLCLNSANDEEPKKINLENRNTKHSKKSRSKTNQQRIPYSQKEKKNKNNGQLQIEISTEEDSSGPQEDTSRKEIQ